MGRRATTGQRLARAAAVVLVLVAAGCGDVVSDGEGGPAASGEPLELTDNRMPVTMNYRVTGTPIVGQPVAVEIGLAPDDGSAIDDHPLILTYRAPEAESLAFPDGQAAQIAVVKAADGGFRPQQITTIPQRDGRVFLTVTAAVETDTGSVSRSLSVPLDVRGAASDAE